MRDEKPIWRPISEIEMVTDVAVQGLEFARESLDTIKPARPYSLDDATVARMLQVWGDAQDFNDLFAEQAVRWKIQSTSPEHDGAVANLSSIVDEERTLIDEVLLIAQKLESYTIEKLLAKSDAEVGLEALTDPWLRNF